jgi:uncharacterized Zn-binding protein involved in type VI secretion
VEDGPPLVLRVVVRAVAAFHHPEAVAQDPQRRPEGVGGPALEPADPAGTAARQHGATVERRLQQRVDALPPPHVEHVGGVAAADVDHVGAGDELGDVVVLAVEQAQVARPAAARVERLVERDDVGRVVAGRRPEEHHRRVVLARGLEDVVVQGVVAAVHDDRRGARRADW